MINLKDKIPINAKEIMQKLIDNGFEVVIQGGFVRDVLLGVEPHDVDIFTNCTDLLKVFSEGKVMGGEERQAKILTIIVNDIEISSFRKGGGRTETGGTLEEHTASADLTINSIAMDINGKIIDTQKGVDDLHNNVIRFVGNPVDRFKEDKLRVLRFLRFECKYRDFKPEGVDDFMFIRMVRELKKDFPQERVREELLKILSMDEAYKSTYFYLFLCTYFEEFRDCNVLGGGKFHDELVGTHLINALGFISKITDNPLLRFAALFHDIGKAESKSIKDDGLHFYNHEIIGADIIGRHMDKLKFSKADMIYVNRLIRSHMYSYKSEPKLKSYVRFFGKLERDNVPVEDYIMLLYSDNQGNMAKPRIKFGDFIKGNWLYKKYFELKHTKVPFKVSDLEVKGKDVMDILKCSPGPIIGDTLRELFNKVMDGILENNRKDLLNFLRNRGN